MNDWKSEPTILLSQVASFSSTPWRHPELVSTLAGFYISHLLNTYTVNSSSALLDSLSSVSIVSSVIVQSPSHAQLFVIPWTAAHQASLPFTVFLTLLTHGHWVSDTKKPSHPLSPSSPPALNLSQHQGLFQWVGSSHQVAKVLGLQLQNQSFQ